MHNLRIVIDPDKPMKLSKANGQYIISLISRYLGLNQSEYAAMIDMDRGLLSRYLNGQINITMPALQRILSGIKFTDDNKHLEYVAEWQTVIHIKVQESQTGRTAKDADCTNYEPT
jgi:transcriptional regulator with XRE-family HTH domain